MDNRWNEERARREAAGRPDDRRDRDEDVPADYGYGRDSYAAGFRRGYAQDHRYDYEARGGYGGPGALPDRPHARGGRRLDPREMPREWRGVPDRDRGWWERLADNLASWMGNEDAEYARFSEHDRHVHGHQDALVDHYGRGPRNYKRTDARIHEDVNDRLTVDRWLDASEIEVSVANGEVTLDGRVATRQDKRRAEDIADHVSGVTHVQNNLRIGVPAPARAPTETAATVEGVDRPGATVRTDGGPIH